MANTYVDILKEIISRITEAQKIGNRLEYVKSLYVGQRSRVAGQADTPSITIKMDGITENADVIKSNRITSVMTLVFQLDYPVSNEYTNADNQLYNGDTECGIIYMIEDFLDVLYEDTAGTLETSLNNALHKTFWAEVGPIVKNSENIMQVEIVIEFNSTYFIINGRSS